MKRLWAAAAILAISLVLCWLGLRTTLGLSDGLNATLQEASAAAEEGDLEQALLLSEQAQKSWRESHRVLSTYIPHTRLEAIDLSLAALPSLAQNGAVDSFQSECARASVQITSLEEAEMPILENIL